MNGWNIQTIAVSGVSFGDLVEVCTNSTASANVTVWLGTTVLNSSTTNYDSIGSGKSRSYRYISGPIWTTYGPN